MEAHVEELDAPAEQDHAPTLTDVAQGPADPQTPAQLLRAAFEEAQQARKVKEMALPAFGGPDSDRRLIVEYRALSDYTELRGEIQKTMKTKGRAKTPAQKEMILGRETLRLASTGSYALINDERVEIGHPLGLELYAYLFGANANGPQGDHEAIHLLYNGDTTVMMTQYAELDQWIRNGGVEAEEETLGN